MKDDTRISVGGVLHARPFLNHCLFSYRPPPAFTRRKVYTADDLESDLPAVETRTCIEAEPFALRVTDDSMAPEFFEGCVVIVDPTGRATDGAFVLAEVGDGYLFRRLRVEGGEVRLEALNPSYPAVRPEAGIASVKGVIVQRAGARRKDHKRYD